MAQMSWHHEPMVSFDCETTGIDPFQDRIVTASVLHIDPATGHIDRYHWLVDPGCDIPEPATAIHGISTEHARTHGRRPAEVLLEIGAHLGHATTTGTPLVVYNAPYDLTLLLAECARYNVQTPAIGMVVDPLVIDRAVDRYRPGSRKLTAVSAHYGVPLTEADAHGSLADALAAARVAWKLATRYPRLADLADLQERQAMWHAHWAEHYEQWLAEQPDREPETIPRDWPIRRTPAVV